MAWNWKGFVAVFVIGAAIISVGLAISWVTNSTIANIQFQLQGNGLSTAERDTLRGSLGWWEIQRTTFYGPISEFVVDVGLIVVIFSVIYAVLSITGGFLDRTKRVKIEITPTSEKPAEEPRTAPKPKVTHITGFPIAAGVLTIIAASIIIFYAFLTVTQMVTYANSNYYQQNLTYLVYVLFAGIWNFVAFGLGLTGGLFSLRRKHFMLTVVGMSLLLVGGFVAVAGTGIIGGGWTILGIPVIILAILSIIFVGVSKNEFID